MQAKEQNISPIKQRILKFASTLGISKRDFYANIGVSRGTLESKTGITEDVVAKFIAKYPDVSPEWLLTGNGNMLSTPSSELSITQNEDTSNNTSAAAVKTKPRIPFYAVAGALTSALNGVTAHECEFLPIIPTLPYYDFTIPVRGDSMYPEFCSGDEVACRLIDDPSFLQWGRAHVLDTSQGVVIKRIYQDGDTILCKSANPQYEDFNIPKEEIFRMAIVVGIVRQY